MLCAAIKRAIVYSGSIILFFLWQYLGKHLTLTPETGPGSSFLSKPASIPLLLGCKDGQHGRRFQPLIKLWSRCFIQLCGNATFHGRPHVPPERSPTWRTLHINNFLASLAYDLFKLNMLFSLGIYEKTPYSLPLRISNNMPWLRDFDFQLDAVARERTFS